MFARFVLKFVLLMNILEDVNKVNCLNLTNDLHGTMKLQ